jgi:hypothetical protein
MKRGAVLFLVSSLSSFAGAMLPNTEYVITKGMQVTANTPIGTISIVGGDGTDRSFSGNDWHAKRSLIPRTERWYGSLGLYDPASSSSPYGRIIVDEGRLFFDSESEALRYFYPGSNTFKIVYNNRGLVVVYSIIPIPGGEPTRSLKIWQIYVRGKIPQTLRGADDSAIQVAGGNIPESAEPNPAPVGYPVILGDREYVPIKKTS